MAGWKLLLQMMLISLMSLLQLQMVNGQQVAEESCTIQILVPGLKGMSSHSARCLTNLQHIIHNKCENELCLI